jgi:hypothetical protein
LPASARTKATTLAGSGLSVEECDLIRRRDWRGLIQYGAIFFVLESFP